MGIRDHKKTWRFEVNAPPAECVGAFARAFAPRNFLLNGGSWNVSTNGGRASATYRGRRGPGAIAAAFSKQQAAESDAAAGSQVTFETQSSGGSTVCVMELGSSGSQGLGVVFGATADARFMRPHMQAVQKELRQVDPAVVVSKS